MSITRPMHISLASVALMACTTATSAAILNVRQMELDGEATVTASPWDAGHRDALFDQNWISIYRSAAINPAIITVEFVAPQTIGAARGKFTNTTTHDWTLEAADSVADLDAQTGTYVSIFGPERVEGTGIQWMEWNDTPVTRLVFRFTVYRVYGDNYVHIRELELQSPEPVEEIDVGGNTVRINVIELDPADGEVAEGGTLQFAAEATLSYGPDRYDVTDQATWDVDEPGVAAVDSAGLATGISAGITTVNADIGVVHGEAPLTVRLARPVDLDVGFIHRTPEYNRFKVSFDGDQHVHPDYKDEKKWPDPDEVVTYTAHVFNRGDADVTNIAYRWFFDDGLVHEGSIASLAALEQTTVSWSAPWPADTVQTINLAPGAMTLHPRQLERAIGDHRIRFQVDPLDTVAEGCELNNVVEDYINALTFWLFMDETTYDLFSKRKNHLESYSPENWGRMQLIGFERRLRVSGCPQKLRLDMLAVYPDGDLSGGGTHEPTGSETRQADGRWGFQIGEWLEPKIDRYAKIVENTLTHEWGHQIGLIDVYQYDIATGNCLITHDGALVAGTDLMPPVSPWNVFYGNINVMHAAGVALKDYTNRALMSDAQRHHLGTGSAVGMNRNLGLRRGFFGDYLGAIQQGEISIVVRHQDGTPVPSCAIRVFQRELSQDVPDIPKFVGLTDTQGNWVFPESTEPGWHGGITVNNPWSWTDGATNYDAPAAGGGNVPLVVELTFDDIVEYHFIEADACNIAFGQGTLDDYAFVLTTYHSREGNRLPVISFDRGSTTVQLTEGEFFETTVSAPDPDGDLVALSATSLYNSTFDPDTGRFTFRPDSLQVNRHGDHLESNRFAFTADDGKFTATSTIWFDVSDVDGYAYVHETVREGSMDGDGDVDLNDYRLFYACITGPAGSVSPDCYYADSNIDDHVDLMDFAAFQAGFIPGP